MSKLLVFLKGREPKKHVKFAACKDWTDEKGKVIEWELRPLESGEQSKIRARCMTLGGNGKKMTFDTDLYNRLIASISVVSPNLKDPEILDYLLPDLPLDERTPENAICKILRDDSEFQALIAEVTKLNNWDSGENSNGEAENVIEFAKN